MRESARLSVATTELRLLAGASLTTRIAWAASSLTLVVTLAMGVLSYQVSREQLQQSMGSAVEREAALLADTVASRLDALTTTLSPLAGNALIINSLMDSFTRDTSLEPFLHDFGGVHGIPVAVALTDFEGLMVASTPQRPSSVDDWTTRVLVQGEPFVAWRGRDGARSLLVAEPVHLSGTLSPEGALLYEVPLAALLVRGPEDDHRATMVRLWSRGTHLVARLGPDLAGVASNNPLRSLQPVRAAAPLSQLELAIEVVADPSLLTEPLEKLTSRYVLIAALTVAVVLALSLAMARYLSRPLRMLESIATSIVDSGSFSARFDATGMPEVVRLGEAFNRMLDRLSGAYGELATRAEEQAARREALAAVNAELEKEVADRQRAESELARHAGELARSNAELESFAYVASHDMHEPLRKVQAFGGLLERELAGSASPTALDYVQRMRSASNRMQALIDDLLRFSRVSAPRTVSSEADLAEVLREVVSNLEIALRDTGASIEHERLPVVACDAVHMRQLLQNLVGNSLKYRRQGVAPQVRIGCGPPSNDAELERDGAGLCEITVQDNGIGFEQKHAERVFGVFQRLHGRNEYEGTGIGLAICRKIVDYYGGRIGASSVPGEGSTFTFTLPLAEARQAPASDHTAYAPGRAAASQRRACR